MFESGEILEEKMKLYIRSGALSIRIHDKYLLVIRVQRDRISY